MLPSRKSVSVMYEEGTIEWFKVSIWPINPVTAGPGTTLETAYYFANRAIGDRLPDDTFLTWQELAKRYQDYYN